MLKKRIIPVQLLMNDRLVKTLQFGEYRDVGNPISSSKVYSDSDADELVFLNINRSERSVETLKWLIEKVSEVCFMPLAVGGGIKSLEDARSLIRNGADKIILNSVNYFDYSLISSISNDFGSQAVVISVDVRKDVVSNEYFLFSDCGRKKENIRLEDHLDECVSNGAGEVFVNSIDRDGMMGGYDIELIRKVSSYLNVPVIGCGGAGNVEHLRDAFLETKVSALACSSLFNFGDNNPIRAKSYLSNYGLNFKVI